MALFDFMKKSGPQQAATAPEQSKASPSVSNLPEGVKAQAIDAGRPAVAHIANDNTPKAGGNEMPSNQSDGKEALMHNQSGAGKTQEALSPTDSHKGHTQSQSRGRGWER